MKITEDQLEQYIFKWINLDCHLSPLVDVNVPQTWLKLYFSYRCAVA
jgi:hypothetical protein